MKCLDHDCISASCIVVTFSLIAIPVGYGSGEKDSPVAAAKRVTAKGSGNGFTILSERQKESTVRSFTLGQYESPYP